MTQDQLRICGYARLALAAAVVAAIHSTATGADTLSTYSGLNNGLWNIAGNWTNVPAGSFVPNNGNGGANYNVVIGAVTDPNVTVHLDANLAIAIDMLTIDSGSVLDFDNGSSITVAGGTVSNAGVIKMLSIGSGYTGINLAADTTLSGGGTITLQSISYIAGNFTLTNVNNTIQGEANYSGAYGLGFNQVSIVNQAAGVINANSTNNGGILLVDPGSAGGLTNTGLLEATNSGTLRLTGNGGGAYANTGGIIKATGVGSVVDLFNGAAVTGGTLTSDTGGIVQTAAGYTSSLTNVTMQGIYVVQNGATTTFFGNIVNTGSIQLNSIGSSFTGFELGSNVQLSGGGTLSLQSISYVYGFFTLTNVNNIIQGEACYNGFYGLGTGQTSIINQAAGVIKANVASATLVVEPGTTGGLINTGLLEATNGGNLELLGSVGTFNNAGGVIMATGSGLAGTNSFLSSVTLAGGTTITGGTLTANSGGFIQTLANNTSTLANLTIQGPYILQNGATTTFFGNIANTGSIQLNSLGYSFTGFALGSNVQLSGGGTVSLQSISYVYGYFTLTNVNNTIQGEASFSGSYGLGTGQTSIVNQAAGVIKANVAGATLIVQPGTTSGLANTGLLEAINGGNLELMGGGGAFNNAGGTIKATGSGLAGTVSVLSSITLVNNASISGGSLTSDTGAYAQVTNSASLANMTMNGAFVIQNAAFASFSGAIVNTGSILLNSNNSGYTHLDLGTDVTLSGGGTITFQNTSYLGNAHTFTNVDNLIQGDTNYNGTSIGANQSAIVNQTAGIFNANHAGLALVIDPGTASGLTNNGLLEATGGGILQLTGSGGGAFNNAGGVIRASETSSIVDFVSSAAVSGGTLTSDTGGLFQILSGDAAWLSNLILNGNLVVQNSGNLHVSGNITNNGTILVASISSSYTRMILEANTILTGGGTITLQQYDDIQGYYTLINAGNTIQGEASFASEGLGANDLTIVNQTAGLINANVNGKTLLIDPGTGGFLNAGILRASAGGTALLTGNGGGSFTNTGTYEALAGSALTMDASAILNNNNAGTLTGGTYRAVSAVAGATVTIRGSAITDIATNTIVELNGTGSIFQAGTTALETSLTQIDGTLEVLSNRNYTTANNITNNGTVQLGGGIFTASNFTNNAAALLTGYGTVGNGMINNTGTVSAIGGVLTLGSTISQLSGTTLTAGSWQVYNNSALVLPAGSTIATNNANVLLSGPGSVFAAINALATNNGSFQLLANRSFTASSFINNGLLGLGGGTFASTALTNNASGTVAGFGTLNNGTFSNLGVVQAINGAPLTIVGSWNSAGSITATSSTLNIGNSSASTFRNTGLISLLNSSLNMNISATIGGTFQGTNSVVTFSSGTFNITTPLTLTNSSINFNAVTETVAGISGTGSVSVGAGAATIIGAANYNGPTTITAGILDFSGGVSHSIGTVSGAGTLQVEAGTTLNSQAVTLAGLTVNGTHVITAGSGVSTVSNLTLAGSGPSNWTGLLDLTNNPLIVHNGGNVPSQIKQAQNGGLWNGTAGITSSTVVASLSTTAKLALGYASGTEYTALNSGSTTFADQPIIATDELIKPTLAGDASMDGTVNFSDFLAMLGSYNHAGDWTQGDFNGDGVVNFTDFLAMLGNYNHTYSPSPIVTDQAPSLSPAMGLVPSAAVPEPGSLVVLGLGAVGLMGRRRRRDLSLET